VIETTNKDILKFQPFGEYEYVDVSFAAADVDTVIPYSVLTPEDPNSVRWIDINPTTVWDGATDTRGYVYRSANPLRRDFGTNYIILRSNVAGYATRLLLFVERQ
jgi:hypothetical protein